VSDGKPMISSGAFTRRKDLYRSKSYVIFVLPPTISGAENAKSCISTPATTEPIAQHTLRAMLVTALAKLLSFGATNAATYDCRGGTSISTKASRAKNSKIASFADGALRFDR